METDFDQMMRDGNELKAQIDTLVNAFKSKWPIVRVGYDIERAKAIGFELKSGSFKGDALTNNHTSTNSELIVR